MKTRFGWWLGLGLLVLFLAVPEGRAQTVDGAEWVARTVSGDTATAPKLPPAVKKKALEDQGKPKPKAKAKAKKRAAAKKKAAKKKAPPPPPKAKKYALGIKGGMMPFSDMNVTRPGAATGDTREIDYDFGIMWGWGAQLQYRLMKNFYLAAEMVYWYPKVKDTTNHPETTDTHVEFRENDGLLNLGIGARFNILGGEATTDRVYLKGHVGFTDYVADDANLDEDNRAGIYFNALVGIEHMFSRAFTVYADGGYLFNSFMAAGDKEDEASLQGLVVNAGFLFHWD